MNSIVGCADPNHYRNKSQIPVGRDKNGNVITGFFGNHSHRIIDCAECKLHPTKFDEITSLIKKWITNYNISVYDETTGKGLLRHIYIRHAKSTDQIMVCLVINGNDIPHRKELTESITCNYSNVKSRFYRESIPIYKYVDENETFQPNKNTKKIQLKVSRYPDLHLISEPLNSVNQEKKNLKM